VGRIETTVLAEAVAEAGFKKSICESHEVKKGVYGESVEGPRWRDDRLVELLGLPWSSH